MCSGLFVRLAYLCCAVGVDVSLENCKSVLKVDESTMRQEFDGKMMLIIAVSMPNDVRGKTH